MRSIQIILQQNLGNGAVGMAKTVSAQLVSLADKNQEVDGTNKLTKVTPGDMPCTVLDPDGSIWAFIQNDIQAAPNWSASTAYALGTTVNNGGSFFTCTIAGTSASSGGPTGTGAITDGSVQWTSTSGPGLFPPWFQLLVGNQVEFTGLVDLPRCKQNTSADDYSVQIAAVDWSISLATSYLGSPTALPWKAITYYAQGATCLNGGSVYFCKVAGTSAASKGPVGAIPAQDGGITWQYQPPAWTRPLPSAANNGSAPSGTGVLTTWMQQTGGIVPGATLNTVIFEDPCEWTSAGEMLSLTTAPVLMATLAVGGGPSFPGVYMTSAGQLPLASYFPAGMLVQLSDGAGGLGIMVQVSADGTAWVSPYDTTPSGEAFKIIGTPADLQNLAPALFSPNGWNVCQLGASPWPQFADYLGYGWSGGGRSHADFTFYSVADFFALQCAWFEADFTIASPTAQDLDYWTVTVPVPNSFAGAVDTDSPVNVLNLNSVDGGVVGDSICLVNTGQSQSWTVAGVDPVMCQVITVEPVTDVPLDAHIYWTPQSQSEMVMEDARVILAKAALPYHADTSLLTLPTTQDPVFCFVPLRPLTGNNLWPVGDIEPDVSGVIKVSTGANWSDPTSATWAPKPSYSWVGTPSAGWGNLTTSVYAPNADWTCQTDTAPAHLMPYDVSTINPWQRLRNRAYSGTAYMRENNGLIVVSPGGIGSWLVNGAGVGTAVVGSSLVYTYVQNGATYTSGTGPTGANFSVWSPTGANAAGELAVYDYTTSPARRLVFNGATGNVSGTVSIRTWSGTAWNAATVYSWPGSSYIQSAVPMIGTPGAVLAYAVTAGFGGTINNSTWESAGLSADRLELWNPTTGGGLLATLATANIPAVLLGGTLVTTPYGVFLVKDSALAEITYTPGNPTLGIASVYLADSVDVIFANSLVARTSTEIVLFGRLDTGTISAPTTETWMLRLSLPLQASLDTSVIWSELVAQGAPPLIGAMRDPSSAGSYADTTERRIVGHYGGSIWQLDTTRSWCLDRFTPGGMTGMELIEHICQSFNALAIPDATGTMHIVSRIQDDEAIALTVNKISFTQARNWPDFASIVGISSQDGNFNYYAYGQQGGVMLTVGNHPLCYSLSACAAMAESLVQWFGVPRYVNEETWFYADSDTAAPWEGIPLFTKLAINGSSPVRLMGMSQNYITGKASVKLVTA